MMMMMKKMVKVVELYEQKASKDKENQGGLIACLRVHRIDQICL